METFSLLLGNQPDNSGNDFGEHEDDENGENEYDEIGEDEDDEIGEDEYDGQHHDEDDQEGGYGEIFAPQQPV